MKKSLVLIAITFFMLFLMACLKPARASESQIVLKFSALYGPNFCIYKDVFVPWTQELEKRTKGRVKTTFYLSETLGKAKDQYDLVARGIADICDTALVYTPGRFPLSSVFDLPLGIPSAKVAGQVAHELFKKYLYKEYPGVKVLALQTTDPGQIYTTKKPIRSLEDIKGVRLRVAGQWVTAITRALGGSPLNIPGPDAPDALQKGMAEGIVIPDAPLMGFGVGDLVKYRTGVNLYVVPTVTIMNLKTWNSLPADIQKIIEEMSGPALNEKYAASWDNEAQVSRDTLKKGGVENIQLSPEEMKAWNQRLKPVTEAWVAEMESKGLPGKKIFEEALALVHKYSK